LAGNPIVSRGFILIKVSLDPQKPIYLESKIVEDAGP